MVSGFASSPARSFSHTEVRPLPKGVTQPIPPMRSGVKDGEAESLMAQDDRGVGSAEAEGV